MSADAERRIYGFTVDLDNALEAARATDWFHNGGGDPNSEQAERAKQEAWDTRQQVIAQYEALLSRRPAHDEEDPDHLARVERNELGAREAECAE